MNDRGEDRGEKMGLLRQRTERKARVVRPCLHSDGIRQYRRAVTPLLLKQADAPLLDQKLTLRDRSGSAERASERSRIGGFRRDQR